MIDPEIGFTSGVITDAERFVGRADIVRDCVTGLNTPLGLIAVHGSRGVGKSSILRQIQAMAIGDYTLAKKSLIATQMPAKQRNYITVFYTCDKLIQDGTDLLKRLCNDQEPQDGLLRLIPNDGKEIVEFSRSKEADIGTDLKVVKWGVKGVETSKYAKTIPGDVVQTFRNYVNAVVEHQVKKMKRDGLLILLDEFDMIKNKDGIGSIIKSLSSNEVKFAISGIGSDLSDLVIDHGSVERLLEEGAIHILPMPVVESREIITKAEELFEGQISFDDSVKNEIAKLCQGFPYLVQLFGKECVRLANQQQTNMITRDILNLVLATVRSGEAFPTLETQYQRAIGNSDGRQILLHLLAEQDSVEGDPVGTPGPVSLSKVRDDAKGLDVEHIDQLMPRLVDEKYGPFLRKENEKPGIYSFVNPTLRVYIRLRRI